MKTTLLAFSLLGNAWAQSNRPPPRRPPEEAFAACANAQEGDACTVKLPDRSVSGKCVKVPPHLEEDAGKLFCMPPHPPRE